MVKLFILRAESRRIRRRGWFSTGSNSKHEKGSSCKPLVKTTPGVSEDFTPGVLTLILRAKRSGVEKNSYEDSSRQARTVKRFSAESDLVLDKLEQ